jgi:hypothetical protein
VHNKLVAVFILVLANSLAFCQPSLYDINTIQKIELFFDQTDWDYQLDTAKAGAEGYVPAAYVLINGVRYDSVAVRYKGNSSYNPNYVKNPIHIALDEFKDQSYQGYTDIKLGNNYADPSMIREVLAYKILGTYMDCPRSNFAELYINNNYIGLYANDESINKAFCSNHFYSKGGTFIKCNPVLNPSPNIKSNLKYISSDSSSYFNYYEIKSDFGWNDLVNLCDSLQHYSNYIDHFFDVDRLIWMLAFNNTLVNLDSYSGVFCQNYYIYRDLTNRYNPIIWDLNMSFGGFPYLGNSNNSMGSLTVNNMLQLPLTIHATDPYWPLINIIMSDSTYRNMYLAHIRTIVNDYFISGQYETIALQLQALIDASVAADTNKFFSYAQFQSALTTNMSVGNYSIPGISNLVSGRITYLQSQSEFTALPPTIQSITHSPSAPAYQSSFFITAEVDNSNSNDVYLGYRYYVTEKFTRIKMFDDGLHGDGAAGDHIYGAQFTMNADKMQYYIYAQNNTAGIFSPERAEFEYHTIFAEINPPTQGQLVINEFMASNRGYKKNEYGHRTDWIELYNNSDATLNLFGCYLSDNFQKPQKYGFTYGTTIAPKSFLTVWADDSNSTNEFIHVPFSLSAAGEELILSNSYQQILDSITFGFQYDDVSTGRCPDGNGQFIQNNLPSFDGPNCVRTVAQTDSLIFAPIIYPNPTFNNFIIIAGRNTGMEYLIYDYLGNIIKEGTLQSVNNIDASSWSQGIYFFRTGSTSRKISLIRNEK